MTRHDRHKASPARAVDPLGDKLQSEVTITMKPPKVPKTAPTRAPDLAEQGGASKSEPAPAAVH